MYEDLSPASFHSDRKIFEPSFEDKNSCDLCDLIAKTIPGLETHLNVNSIVYSQGYNRPS